MTAQRQAPHRGEIRAESGKFSNPILGRPGTSNGHGFSQYVWHQRSEKKPAQPGLSCLRDVDGRFTAESWPITVANMVYGAQLLE